jgi:hypothetical protein
MNGIRMTPLINGVEPAWGNLTVNIAGVPLVAITAIDYDENQNIENHFGAGQTPISRGYGNIEATGKLTLLMSEVEAIRASSVSGRLQDIAPFDIIVSYVPQGSTSIITHKLRNCQFKNNPVTQSQGATKTEVNLDLIISHIEWN